LTVDRQLSECPELFVHVVYHGSQVEPKRFFFCPHVSPDSSQQENVTAACFCIVKLPIKVLYLSPYFAASLGWWLYNLWTVLCDAKKKKKKQSKSCGAN
jgi:hypothetical protein